MVGVLCNALRLHGAAVSTFRREKANTRIFWELRKVDYNKSMILNAVVKTSCYPMSSDYPERNSLLQGTNGNELTINVRDKIVRMSRCNPKRVLPM